MADETMSLEQVRDWHLQECEIWQEAQEDDNAEHNLACARAIEVAIAERKVPHGWQLVPIVPTLAMLVAGRQTLKGSSDEADGLRAKAVYTRMLAAASKVTP